MFNSRYRMVVFFPVVFLFLGLIAPDSSLSAEKTKITSDLYKTLSYRPIGPVGNRVSAVIGVPGDPNTLYAGAASGGIFKSIDNGVNWKPVFDKMKVQSIGSLAVAPSDPNVVWAGTGEAFIRSNISHGNGIYRSTDAGKSWARMGLETSGRIGRIVIHPRDPERVFAACLGHCYGPQPERGVFRTTDGGNTWKRVLFVDENTGCSDIAMDPNNPRILFAGMWPMLIRTWGKWSGGPGGGLYRSTDGGETWTRLEKGLPKGEIGKVAVAVAPRDSERVYALIEADKEGLWRSDDGGSSWTHINPDHGLLNRPLYYTRLVVAPDDPDDVYFPATRFHMTRDGGEHIRGFSPYGGDHHDMWIDPLAPARMLVGNDQGVGISTNRGKTWHGVQLPIAQMYHVYVDNRVPYYVYGNRQDGSSYMGPSNSRMGRGGIPRGLWHPCGGFESGFAVPDPVDPDIVWSGNYDGMLDVFDRKTMQSRAVSVWPESIQGWAAGKVKYRFNWTFPIAVSPHDHNQVYVGSQYVHTTLNRGQSWSVISPDLTTNDPEKLKRSGGLTQDDASPLYGCCVFAIAESPLEKGQIWAGTNDGRLHVTRDGGSTWRDVSDRLPDLPPEGTVSNIEPSRHTPGVCYVTFDLHQVNDFAPHVFKTGDYGAGWTRIVSGIPESPLSFAHCIREDPERAGMLYLGTESSLFLSWDDGGRWLPLQNNLPHAPVHWLVVQEHFSDLVAGTYGRGFWIMDDITPLRGLTREVVESEAHLFPPRPAYRFRNVAGPSGSPNDPCAGKNPEYGAALHYYLKSDLEDDIVISITDARGHPVRILKTEKKEDLEPSSGGRPPRLFKVPGKKGLNRIYWDLRYDKTRMIRLRTSPPGADFVKVGPEGWRRFPRGSRSSGPLAPPGEYTVTMRMGEKSLSRKLSVRKDPYSAGSEADIRAQTGVLLQIHEEMNAVAAMINRIEWIRRQIHDLEARLKGRPKALTVIQAGRELDKKIIALESELFSMEVTGSGDSLRWPDRFYVKLRFLARDIGSSDFPPTDQQLEVHAVLKKRLTGYQTRLDRLISGEAAAFNKTLKERGLPHILTDIE